MDPEFEEMLLNYNTKSDKMHKSQTAISCLEKSLKKHMLPHVRILESEWDFINVA